METFNDTLARCGSAESGIIFPDFALLSYRALGALVRGNARHFAAQGIQRGDYVAIALESDREHVVALLALMALGAVPVSVKPPRGPAEAYAADLARMLARFGVRRAYRTVAELPGVSVVSWDPSAETGDCGGLAEVSPQDTCFIQFSSGSTSDPKPIPISHGNLMANLRTIAGVDRRSETTLVYSFLPLHHDMGLVGGLLTNIFVGNPIYLTPLRAFVRNPLAFFSWSRSREVGTAMPDFALRYLARCLAAKKRAPDPQLLAGTRTIYCGAEPIRYGSIVELLDAAVPWGLDPSALIFCYGMAEATLLVTAHRFESLSASFADGPLKGKIARVGEPANVEVVAGGRDESGRILRASGGTEGTLFVRGPSVFRGYLGGPTLVDGWHDTGDLGFERDGAFYVSGRTKDVIIVNGENIFPVDIEAVVLRFAGVRDCVVMSDTDRFYLFVSSNPGASVDREKLAGEIGVHFGTTPSGIAVGMPSEIMRTTSGKPMRQAMLAQFRAHGSFP